MSKQLSIEGFLNEANTLREQHVKLIQNLRAKQRPYTIKSLREVLEEKGYDIEEHESAILSFEMEYEELYKQLGLSIDCSRENENLDMTNFFLNF